QEVIDGIRQGKLNKVPGESEQPLDKETVKNMFAEFKKEILNELKENNINQNEPTPTATKQSKRKGFIF
ncbi:hypothetical protein, partial [Halolactibacillus halophilus]